MTPTRKFQSPVAGRVGIKLEPDAGLALDEGPFGRSTQAGEEVFEDGFVLGANGTS